MKPTLEKTGNRPIDFLLNNQATAMMRGLARRPEYATVLQRTPQHLRRKKRGEAIAAAASAALADPATREKPTRLQSGLILLSEAPAMLRAEHRLEKHDSNPSRHLSTDYDAAKNDVIRFNHALALIIDNDAKIKHSEVKEFCSSAINTLYGPDEARFFNKYLNRIISGLLHESAFDSASAYIPGIREVWQADVDEERRGVDRIIDFNGELIKVDIKSTQKGEEEALLKIYDSGHFPDPYPVWSGFYREDFGDSFRIDDQNLIESRAAYLANTLEEIHRKR